MQHECSSLRNLAFVCVLPRYTSAAALGQPPPLLAPPGRRRPDREAGGVDEPATVASASSFVIDVASCDPITLIPAVEPHPFDGASSAEAVQDVAVATGGGGGDQKLG